MDAPNTLDSVTSDPPTQPVPVTPKIGGAKRGLIIGASAIGALVVGCLAYAYLAGFGPFAPAEPAASELPSVDMTGWRTFTSLLPRWQGGVAITFKYDPKDYEDPQEEGTRVTQPQEQCCEITIASKVKDPKNPTGVAITFLASASPDFFEQTAIRFHAPNCRSISEQPIGGAAAHWYQCDESPDYPYPMSFVQDHVFIRHPYDKAGIVEIDSTTSPTSFYGLVASLRFLSE